MKARQSPVLHHVRNVLSPRFPLHRTPIVTESRPLLVETSPAGVRTLTLNRPDRLNAVNPALAEALPLAMADAAQDDAVRVVVITGSGRGFCAGLDLSEPVPLDGGTRASRLDPYYWVGR